MCILWIMRVWNLGSDCFLKIFGHFFVLISACSSSTVYVDLFSKLGLCLIGR